MRRPLPLAHMRMQMPTSMSMQMQMHMHMQMRVLVGLARRAAGAAASGELTRPSPPPRRSYYSSSSSSTSSPSASSLSSSPSTTRASTVSFLHERINDYARMPQKGVTLRQMLSVGERPRASALLASAQFLYKELPIRLAKRVKELESLPYGLSQTAGVLKVRGWYQESFRDILSNMEPQTDEQQLHFTNTLEMIYNRHSGVVPTMALGVQQMKREMGAHGNDIIGQCPFLQDFLNRFYASRIGIRLLISQHLALHHPVPGHIGTIDLALSPVRVIKDAAADASRICERELGFAPDVNVHGDEHATFAFVTSHLHHIMFELLKNSMRAVVERHGAKNYDQPPIEIVVSTDSREFAIKVSDQGGGIPRKDLHRIWTYLYTTNRRPRNDEETLAQVGATGGVGGVGVGSSGGSSGGASNDELVSNAPMAGFGYGLPLSRLYARFFGGDLQLMSMPSYGTDVYLYLYKLGDVDLFVD